MDPLTKKQKDIYDFIKSFINENGYAPSYREIGQYFNLSSTGTIAGYISVLESKGYLTKEPADARAVQLVPSFGDHFDFATVPLEGIIDAGRPIEAIRTNETIDIPKDMVGKKTFALRVRGESMIDDGILEGDYIVIEQTASPRNGEIVVALIDNANATLKRFYDEKLNIRLQPANSTMKPLIFNRKRVTIQGKVRGLIRKFA